ncbi:hypothetical protein DSO57_1015894 [Entomophthora muscae]|uniref:Uncharacterized protein n=1 Tax=Entomophthora muscae TaxID=34485 RepID=A0ACC2S6U8_9FUNG|nr:hypothetical protein DSO57_1015894 [Entomophthora muscae]
MSGESSPHQDNIFSDDLSSQDGPIPLKFLENYKQQSLDSEKTFEEYSDYILVFNPEVAKSFAASAGVDKSSEAYAKYLVDSSSVALSKIIEMITAAGLKVELVGFGKMRIALFISCPVSRIKQEYLSSKIHDYLHGVRVPDIEKLTSNQPKEELLDNIVISTAERLRLVHDILTNSAESGGAGISESKNPYIECLYPVHDRVFNRAWLKRIYSKWRVDYDDLTLARNHFGEELAYYFAFIDFYFTWLFIPAIFGLVFNFFFDVGSTICGILNLTWATIFLKVWSRRQTDLAAKWEVTNASKVEKVRPEFKESYVIRDPVTNEPKPAASFWTSQLKKFVSLPIIFSFWMYSMLFDYFKFYYGNHVCRLLFGAL